MRFHRLHAAAALALATAFHSGQATALEITPAVREILVRYVKATGGDSVRASIRGVHMKGRLRSMGQFGTYESWSQAPDRLLTRIHVGQLDRREGCDGATAWRLDSPGQVVMLDGKEREAMLGDAWFENERWAAAGESLNIAAGSTSQRAAGLCRALDITPPHGPSRRLWFNAKTGLIEEAITYQDQNESHLWYSSWRTARGRAFPTVADGLPPEYKNFDFAKDAEKLTIDSIQVNPPFEAAIFSPPRGDGGTITWSNPKRTARIPVRYGSHHVWVKASIDGGPPADFLLDTGASISLLDRSYAAAAGIATRGRTAVQGMGGLGEMSFASLQSVRLGAAPGDRVTVENVTVGVLDLGEGMESVLWRRVSGLIGADLLDRFAVEIDYDTPSLTLTDPARWSYSGTTEPIPMRLMDGIPTIEVTLDADCTGEFLVDVGNAFGMVIHGSMVRRCTLLEAAAGRKQVEMLGGGIGDAFASWLVRLGRIQLGPHAWEHPIAAISLSRQGIVGSTDYSGNVGNSVLEQFRCTFDYAHRRLYLDPGKRFGEHDRPSRCGTLLVKDGDRVLVGSVARGSAADEGGLRPGDEVTALDGKPILRFTLDELDRVLDQGTLGSTHTFSIKRDGEASSVSVTLADLL